MHFTFIAIIVFLIYIQRLFYPSGCWIFPFLRLLKFFLILNSAVNFPEYWIRETPDSGSYLPVSRLEYENSWIIA